MISILIITWFTLWISFDIFKYYFNDVSIMDELFCTFSIIVFGLLFGSFVSVSIGSVLPKDDYMSYTEPIISVELGSEVNGSFILGSGGISEDLKYYYYKQDDYGFRLQGVYVNDTYILEDSEYPLIEVYSKRFSNNSLDRWFICPDENVYKIRLPQNSIVREIELGGQY